jgi:hypothetical protein
MAVWGNGTQPLLAVVAAGGLITLAVVAAHFVGTPRARHEPGDVP